MQTSQLQAPEFGLSDAEDTELYKRICVIAKRMKNSKGAIFGLVPLEDIEHDAVVFFMSGKVQSKFVASRGDFWGLFAKSLIHHFMDLYSRNYSLVTTNRPRDEDSAYTKSQKFNCNNFALERMDDDDTNLHDRISEVDNLENGSALATLMTSEVVTWIKVNAPITYDRWINLANHPYKLLNGSLSMRDRSLRRSAVHSEAMAIAEKFLTNEPESKKQHLIDMLVKDIEHWRGARAPYKTKQAIEESA